LGLIFFDGCRFIKFKIENFVLLLKFLMILPPLDAVGRNNIVLLPPLDAVGRNNSVLLPPPDAVGRNNSVLLPPLDAVD
jgi:hypothetical protein